MSSAAARVPPTRVGEERARAASPMRPLSARPAKAPLPVSCRGHSPRRASGAGAGAGAGPIAPPRLRRSHSAGATSTTRMDTPPPPPPPARPAAAAAVPPTPSEGSRTAVAEQQRVQALLLSLGGAQALTALEACWQQQATSQTQQGPLLTTPARESATAQSGAPARGTAAAESSRQDSARQEGARRPDSPGRGRVSQRPPLHAGKGPGARGQGPVSQGPGGGGEGPGEARGHGATKGYGATKGHGPISPPYLGQIRPRAAGQRRGQAGQAGQAGQVYSSCSPRRGHSVRWPRVYCARIPTSLGW